MALLSSLSLSLLRDTPKGKAETKAALKSDSLSTPSRSAGRPAAAAGAASAVSSASGALAALFCADEKGAAESSSTVTVPKTVAKDASLRAPVPVKPLQPKPKGYPKPKPAGRPEAEPKAKAMSSLLGAYSDSEDEEEEQMKPGRLSTAAQAVLATAGANKLRAEAQAPPVLKAPPLVAPAVVAPATAPATAPAAVAPAAAAPRTARAVTVASRMAAAQHHGLAVMKPLVGVGGEERSVERIDMSRIDGEELSPEELPQVAHKCGANAWRWRVREWRPNPRGLPLGNFNALEERSEVSGSRAEEPEVEEDPDMEDFAFFAGLTETTGEPEACELEVPPTASSSSRASAPLAFANAAKEKRQEEEELRQEEERKHQEEEERREEKRRKIEEERRRKEEEEAREREKKRREEAIRQAEEERERRAQRRKMEEEEKKRTEASRIETVKKRAEEIERRRQAEEEFLANAEAQKKAQAKMEVKVPSSLPVAEGSLSALLRTGAPDLRRPAEPAEPPRAPVLERHSRSPRRKPEPKAMPRPPEPKAMPRKPEPKPMPKPEAVPKEMPLNIGSAKEPVGWMPENYTCDSCQKQVSASGGIFCGRRRGQQLRGCGAAVCWRCMNRSSKDLDFGKVRTTKAEFDSLGGEAWWMHEACMDDEDLQDYYDGEEAQFAWE